MNVVLFSLWSPLFWGSNSHYHCSFTSWARRVIYMLPLQLYLCRRQSIHFLRQQQIELWNMLWSSLLLNSSEGIMNISLFVEVTLTYYLRNPINTHTYKDVLEDYKNHCLEGKKTSINIWWTQFQILPLLSLSLSLYESKRERFYKYWFVLYILF